MPSIFTHDCTIEDRSAATPIYGYMFAKQRNGAPRFSIGEHRAVAPRVLTDAQLSESQFDPTVDFPWTQADWSIGFGATDARLHENRLGSGYKVDTSEPGKITLARAVFNRALDVAASSHRVTGFAIVGTEVWVFVGRDVYSWDQAGLQWDIGVEPEAVVKIYRNGVSFEGNTFAPAWAQGTNAADTYIYKADADANWTLSTLTNSDVKYMAVAGSLMYGGNWSDGVNLIRTSTDPTNTGAWSGSTAVGGADAAITGLVPFGDTMLICKADGIYTLQADGTVRNLTPEFEDADQHPDNFKGAYNWNGHILLPLGLRGMNELVGDRLVDISLSRYMPRDTHLHGRVVAIAGNSQELYIMVHEPDNLRYHVLKAIWAEFEGTHDYTWHHVTRQAYTTDTDDDQNALMAEGIPFGTSLHRRIHIGISSTGSSINPLYISLTGETGAEFNVLDDSEAITAPFNAGLPRIPKHFSTLYCETDNLGAGGADHNIQVWHRIDVIGGARAGNGTAGWTSLGTLTSDQQTLPFAAEVTGRQIELLFLPIQGTVQTTAPELLRFTLRSQLRPASVKLIPLVFSFADGQMQSNGVRDYRVTESLVQLRTWSTQTAEVTLRVKNSADLTAERVFNVVFLPGMVKEEVINHEWGRFPEVRVTALVAEV